MKFGDAGVVATTGAAVAGAVVPAAGVGNPVVICVGVLA
jgi:hypothetical protein